MSSGNLATNCAKLTEDMANSTGWFEAHPELVARMAGGMTREHTLSGPVDATGCATRERSTAWTTTRTSRKNKGLSLIWALAWISLAACGSGSEVDRPNVILVITDDQGYEDLSFHGNPTLKTPNLDTLASESVRLRDYHVAPTCSPTRSALQTGRWPNRTGVWHTIRGRSLLRENEMTLGQVFQDAGYATGMFGKWYLLRYSQRFLSMQPFVPAPGADRRDRARGGIRLNGPCFVDDTLCSMRIIA